MTSAPSFLRLQKIAYQLRQQALTMIYQAQSGHPASSLGLAELFAFLYFAGGLRYDPQRPDWEKRNPLFVSNGHISALLYATLAKAGFFPESELAGFRQLESRLQGHPHFLPQGSEKLPGVENSSGPLGQGLSQAAGYALALKMAGKKPQVFCLMSDGEQQEGQIWEAYQFILAHKLTNIVGIIDQNNIQISGKISEIYPAGKLKLKLLGFGFKVFECDGNNLKELAKTFTEAKEHHEQNSIILLKTVPGKGVAFMENDPQWHGKAPSESEYHQAMRELAIKEKNVSRDS
jgi:transketolase